MAWEHTTFPSLLSGKKLQWCHINTTESPQSDYLFSRFFRLSLQIINFSPYYCFVRQIHRWLWIPSQRTNNAESVFMSRGHQESWHKASDMVSRTTICCNFPKGQHVVIHSKQMCFHHSLPHMSNFYDRLSGHSPGESYATFTYIQTLPRKRHPFGRDEYQFICLPTLSWQIKFITVKPLIQVAP